jgi:osmotically-inducible protein OsmY
MSLTLSSAPVAADTPMPVVMDPLLERVQKRLRESPYYYLRAIQCACHEGAVTLRGRVPSFYLKQTVQVQVEKVDGVEQVINLVDVTYPATVDRASS